MSGMVRTAMRADNGSKKKIVAMTAKGTIEAPNI
jgi:hypothetical protein